MNKSEIVRAASPEELADKVNSFYDSGVYHGTPKLTFNFSDPASKYTALIEYVPKESVSEKWLIGQNSRYWSAVIDLERRLITDALAKMDGNKAKAARDLGIAQTLLYSKMMKYGIDDTEYTHTEKKNTPDEFDAK